MAKTRKPRGQGAKKRRVGGKSQRSARDTAPNVLAPNVGTTVARPFPKPGRPHQDRIGLQCWNAFHSSHLALPRAVGPYTTVRTTRRFSTNAKVLQIGAFMQERTETVTPPGQCWTNVCAVEDVDPALPINNLSNAYFRYMPLTGLGSGASVAPAAVSVMMMNPNSLQTTSGVTYMGRLTMKGIQPGDNQTWDSFAEKFVAFQAPRLMANPRVALKGVQVDSAPLDMTDVSNFTHVNAIDADYTATYDASQPYSTGWAPIVVYNANAIQLEFLVTIEWRVRFDLTNPASGGHVHHPIATDSVWDRLTKAAFAMGNGVRDIAQIAETVGRFVPRAAG